MCRDINVFTVRQFLQLCAVSLTTFTVGINTALPSALNPALMAPDAEIKATSDQASWITACLAISAVLGYVIMPTLFEIFGRKLANVATNAIIFIGCMVLYFSKDVYSLALARLIQGIALPGSFTFTIGLYECISPKRRGYYTVLNKISLALGALACHGMALAFNWRQIAIFSALPLLFSTLVVMFSAESPGFYAMGGNFDKCINAFKWYRGDSLSAKKELKEFIAAQTEIFTMNNKDKDTNIFKKIKRLILSKSFRKSFYIVTMAKLSLDFCGRYFILVYITQIFAEITSNVFLAKHLSVVSDLVTILALWISYFLVKHFHRRVLLFNLGFCSVFLMFMISLTLILGNILSLMQYAKWLTPVLIFMQLFVTNVGLIPLVFTIAGEVFSLEHRGIGLIMSGVIFMSMYVIILKFTPLLIDTIGVEGVYMVYGLSLLILLILLRKILVETKDKTLQEIEDELKGTVRKQSETELVNFAKDSNC